MTAPRGDYGLASDRGGVSLDLDVSPDAMRWSAEPPPPRPFRSRRDGRFSYSTEAIDHIESTSCSLGCRRGAAPGSPEAEEFGPGGTCGVLALVAIGDGEPIEDLDDQGDRVVCRVREPLPQRDLGDPVPAVAGQLALIEEVSP